MKKELWYESNYYLEKTPLYIRYKKEDEWDKWYWPIEYNYQEYNKLNKNFKDTLLQYDKQDQTPTLMSEIIPVTKFQILLLRKYNSYTNVEKEKLDFKYEYYQFLVHYLTYSDLINKNDWRQILNLFNLKKRILLKPNKYIQKLQDYKDYYSRGYTTDAHLDWYYNLQLDKTLDDLTKWIFRELFKKYLYVIHEINEITISKVENQDKFLAKYDTTYQYVNIIVNNKLHRDWKISFNNSKYFNENQLLLDVSEEDFYD